MIFSLNQNLSLLVPFFSLVNFLLLIILLYFNREYFVKYLRKIRNKTWIILTLIFILGLILRLFLPLHYHKQGGDEFGYMETAKSLIRNFQGGSHQRSIGWPFIIAIFFGLFGVNNWVAIYLSLIMGALTVLNIFFFSLLLLENEKTALWSAFLFSLLPLHISWSGSAETNVPSLFFITFTLFLYMFYMKERKNSLLWLAIISLAFTVQMRPENYLFPFLFVFCFFIYKWEEKSFKKIDLNFVLPWIFLILLSSFNLIQVLQYQSATNWIDSDSGRRMTGENWSFSNLINNSRSYAMEIFDNTYQPFTYSILLGVGIFYLWKKERKILWLLIVYFFIFYLSYFSSWLQTLGGRSRIFMSFYPITAILAGSGVHFIFQRISSFYKLDIWRKVMIISFIFIIFLSFLPYFLNLIQEKRKPNSLITLFLLETLVPEFIKKDIPNQCSIILQWPQMLRATTDFSLVTIDEILRDEEYSKGFLNQNQCVLFYEDVTCYWNHFHTIDKCVEIHKRYNLVPFVTYSRKSDESTLKYTFYLVKQR